MRVYGGHSVRYSMRLYQVLHHGEVPVCGGHVQRRRAGLALEAVLQVVGRGVLQVEQHLPLSLRPANKN